LLAPALCGARRFGLLRVRRLAFAASRGLLRVPLCLPCAVCRFDSTVGTLRLPPSVGLSNSGLLRLQTSPFPLACVRAELASVSPCGLTFSDQPFQAGRARTLFADSSVAQRWRALPRSRIAPRSMLKSCSYADCSAQSAGFRTAMLWRSVRIAAAWQLDAW
jgi:hypothetical protein